MYCEHKMRSVGCFRKSSDDTVNEINVCSRCGSVRIEATEVYPLAVFNCKEDVVASALVGLNYQPGKGAMLASVISGMVNSFTFSPENFVDAILRNGKLQRDTFEKIVYMWLKRMSFYQKASQFDLRNDYSVNLFGKLFKEVESEIDSLLSPMEKDVCTMYVNLSRDNLFKKNDLDMTSKDSSRSLSISMDDRSFEMDLVLFMSMEHRTLQQTFGRIILSYLMKMPANGDVSKSIREKLIELDKVDDFYRDAWMPMV